MRNKNIARKLVVISLVASLMAGCAATARDESTGQYIDSSAITAKVKSKLLADEQVSGTAIKVNSYKGTVQLSGFVDTYAQEQRAVELAKSVPGVVSVQDSIVVKPRADR